MTKKHIDILLERLDRMRLEPDYFTHFAKPASKDKIMQFEKKFQISLPKSHKRFLSKFNGGMMLYDYQSEFLQTHADYEMYKGDAVYLLSIEEITQRYAQLENRSWKVDRAVTHPYPIIPFCSLPNNELLVFVYGDKSGDESPVFDAYHEEFPSTWGMVAPDFTSFLASYLEALGHPPTMGDEEIGVAADFLDKKEVEDDEEREETPQEVIRRVSEQLPMEPDRAFLYYEKANAHKDMGQYSEAYEEIGRAIELDRSDPFYYFIRGEILTQTDQHRAALIDFDTAVNLKPDETLYLCCRAGSLFYLNKLKPSIDDCNQAIELDSRCLLAYMMRKEIYEVMGMDDLAEADQMMIDRLEKEG